MNYICCSMKTVKIRVYVKRQLEEYADGRPITKVMRELVENAEYNEYVECNDYSSININMDDDVFEKLKLCRVSQSESYSDVIERLLSQASSDKADD